MFVFSLDFVVEFSYVVFVLIDEEDVVLGGIFCVGEEYVFVVFVFFFFVDVVGLLELVFV